MAHIISVGELLVDMLKMEKDLQFNGSAGGAPCNMLAQAVKLGHRCSLITKLGDDYFGHYLKEYAANAMIEVDQIIITNEAHTTLSFVTLDDEGNRSFTFYRKPGSDMMLKKEDIDLNKIDKCDVFLYGGVIFSKNPARKTMFSILEDIKKNNSVCKIYDPNFREALWDTKKEAREILLEGIRYADILKLSDEELFFLTGKDSIEKGIEYLRKRFKLLVIFISLGKYGCIYNFESTTKRLYTYDTNIVDTTASGDSFLGAVISKMLNSTDNLKNIDDKIVYDSVDFGNAAGALTGTIKGAINSLPSQNKIENCMKNVPKLIIDYDFKRH